MALAVGGQCLVLPDPAEGASPEELFGTLCAKFKVSPKVGDHLVKVEGLASLNDFVHRFTQDSELQPVVAAVPDLEKAGLELSRLRQAWHAARAASATAETRKRKAGEDQDIDNLLPAPELAGLKERFYARYKLRFPVGTEPCDQLVSRLTREISRPAPPPAPAQRGRACAVPQAPTLGISGLQGTELGASAEGTAQAPAGHGHN